MNPSLTLQALPLWEKRTNRDKQTHNNDGLVPSECLSVRTCGLGRVTQKVDKVSVCAEVHNSLVLIAHLFSHECGQGPVKPLHVLRLGESVSDDALALVLPQRQQQLRKKTTIISYLGVFLNACHFSCQEADSRKVGAVLI